MHPVASLFTSLVTLALSGATVAMSGAAHAEPSGDPVTTRIVIAAALGENDRLTKVENVLQSLRPGAAIAPLDNAALWAFAMRWDGQVVRVMGGADAVDLSKTRQLLASTHAPSPAYRKVLVASARVLVQSEIVETLARTATLVGQAVARESAELERHTQALADLDRQANALGAQLDELANHLKGVLATAQNPASTPEVVAAAKAELEQRVPTLQALSARIQALRNLMAGEQTSVRAAQLNLDAALHGPTLDLTQRALVAQSDAEVARLQAIAERLAPHLAPDQVVYFPHG